MKFDVKTLLASLIVGGVCWGISMLLFRRSSTSMWMPLLIALLFGILAVLTCAVLRVVGGNRGFMNFKSGGQLLAILSVGIIILLLLAVLFEWLYEISRKTVPLQPSSYVFLIDNSGSMSSNDPDGLRYTAIDQVIAAKGQDFPYAVYSFDDSTELLREMRPASDGSFIPPSATGGSTMMKDALQRVISDFQSGALQGGKSPKVILLTDGYASDCIGLPVGLMNQFNREQISVSTVGLGYDADKAFLQKMARMTCGVYIYVEDVNQLTVSLEQAVSYQSDRDLLHYRPAIGAGWLYGILRVVFLVLLGSGLTVLRVVAVGGDEPGPTLVLGFAQALIGALLMELGNQVFYTPEWLNWLLQWLLLAATPTWKKAASGGSSIYIRGYEPTKQDVGTGSGFTFR